MITTLLNENGLIVYRAKLRKDERLILSWGSEACDDIDTPRIHRPRGMIVCSGHFIRQRADGINIDMKAGVFLTQHEDATYLGDHALIAQEDDSEIIIAKFPSTHRQEIVALGGGGCPYQIPEGAMVIRVYGKLENVASSVWVSDSDHVKAVEPTLLTYYVKTNESQ